MPRPHAGQKIRQQFFFLCKGPKRSRDQRYMNYAHSDFIRAQFLHSTICRCLLPRRSEFNHFLFDLTTKRFSFDKLFVKTTLMSSLALSRALSEVTCDAAISKFQAFNAVASGGLAMCIFIVPLFDKTRAVYAVVSLCGAMVFAGITQAYFGTIHCTHPFVRVAPTFDSVFFWRRGSTGDNMRVHDFECFEAWKVVSIISPKLRSRSRRHSQDKRRQRFLALSLTGFGIIGIGCFCLQQRNLY